MNVTNDLSEKITTAIQDFYKFFANQGLATYAIILVYIILATLVIAYIAKISSMIKISYKDVDHIGFRKINIFILLAVILFCQVGNVDSLPINIFFAAFIVPILLWLIFMIRLFILNIKQYHQKKNFVKNKKKRAEICRQLGVNHRVSKNNLAGTYTTANEMYQDIQTKPIEEEVCSDIFKRRINAESFQERRTGDEE